MSPRCVSIQNYSLLSYLHLITCSQKRNELVRHSETAMFSAITTIKKFASQILRRSYYINNYLVILLQHGLFVTFVSSWTSALHNKQRSIVSVWLCMSMMFAFFLLETHTVSHNTHIRKYNIYNYFSIWSSLVPTGKNSFRKGRQMFTVIAI